MKRYIKYLFIVLLVSVMIDVQASVKCSDGKPGDTVSCVINNAGRGGLTSNIEVDKGLTFVSCDVCSGDSYTIEKDTDATFKFKIADNITESKTLTASFGGETAKIKVVVENNNENDNNDNAEEENTPTIYSVTLVPGNGQSNKTKTCTVNSLNTSCNITLDEIDNENFTGWGKEKNCTEGEVKGSIKVNKNITYYACYKISDTENDNDSGDGDANLSTNILLETLTVKNGDEVINLGFSIRKFEYTINVPTSVETLDVIPTVKDENINVLVEGNDSLTEVENVITISLTKDGNTNKYIIYVIKKDEVLKPLLSSLTIGAYNIDFSPEKFNYNVKIDSRISSLNIVAEPEKETCERTIIGNANLKDGSKINIVVTDPETKESSTYVINIEKENTKLYLYIGISIFVLIILIILLIVVVKKGKKKNNIDNGKKNNTTNKNGINNIKGQIVNSQSNIPDVTPTIPVQPVMPVNQNVVENNNSNNNIETLDL